jgi:hypothetical protein
VTKINNTIKINGHNYNAKTGELLAATQKSAPIRSTARNIDGIVHTASTKSATPLAKPRMPARSTLVAISNKPIMDMARAPAKHHKPHSPQLAKTLMRRSVAKPHPSLKRGLTVQHDLSIATKPLASIAHKPSIQLVDPTRLKNASSVAKHALVSKYAKSTSVQATSAHPNSVQAHQLEIAKVHASEHNIQKTLATHQPKLTMFEKALAEATSHQQPPYKPTKHATKKSLLSPRLRSFATAGLAVLVLGGFLAYQNATNVTLKLASNKAGFSATLPNYRPSGFSVGKFTYNTGSVAVNFKSNSDERSFAITQKASNWDSETLKSNFVASNTSGRGYQEIHEAGRTVYLYGQNNATWVDNGVWYQVQSGGSLSDKQLLDIAVSM